MNSGISPKPIFIAVGALLFLGIISRRDPYVPMESNALPVYTATTPTQVKETKPSIQRYKYRVEIETSPENQIYSIRKSGYQQYEVSRLGESYSYKVYEFYSDKILTTEEAYQFVLHNPGKCTLIKPGSESNIYDQYNDEYESYIDDPEDEINYPPEVFDFLAD